MDTDQIILGKRILIVDDEQDVLESLYDLLDICKLDLASDYQQAVKLLENNEYNLAILDIMGVNGFELLEKAKEHFVPAIMLTAHALTPENLKKSAEQGAAYYAPKEELANIKAIVAEVIHAIESKKSPWEKMFQRLTTYYDKRFNGPDWREKHQEFWNEKRKMYENKWF